MSAFAIVLTGLLGTGGLGGLVMLLRLRTDKDSSVVDMVGRGMLVLERLNDRLEGDLATAREQWAVERAARLASEARLEQANARIRHLEGGTSGNLP